MKTLKRANKLFAVLSSVLMLIQPVLPAFSLVRTPVFAQAADPTPTPEPTVAPTDTPASTPTDTIAPTPTEEVTPTAEVTPTDVPTVTETPTPDVTPTDTVTPDATETPTITTTEPPHETSPPAENGDILPEAASTEAPTPTSEPTPTVTPQPTETGHLETSVLDNVKASSLDLNAVDPSSATLTTDKADYAPTDTALITGTGFLANHTYVLTVSSDDPPATSTTVNVTTDDEGSFVYAYQLDGTYRPNYKVVIANLGGYVIATTTFTDNIGFDKAVYRTDQGKWTTGDAGSSYQEGQWVFYTYAVTDVNSTNVPNFNVVFNFHQSSSNAIFVDAFTNFRYCWDCSPLPDGTSNPPTSTTTWHTFVPANINKEYSGSSCLATNDSEPAADDHCFRVTGGSMFPTDAPGSASHTLRIFFEAHLARTYDWAGGFESQLATAGPHLITPPPESVTPVYGADVYTGWVGTYLGIGSATGSSRHFTLQDQSAGPGGAQALPIPAVPSATGSITVTKVTNPTPATGVTFGFSGDFGAFNLDTDPGTGTSNTITFSNLAQATFVLSEDTPPGGWSLTNLVCTNTTGNSTFSYNGATATVNLAQSGLVTCTYTNSLQQAHLTLTKTVTNDNGGAAVATNWTLSASGPTPISGTTGSGAVTNAEVNGGTYTLSESGPSGYTASSWSCTGGSQNGNQITLAAGGSATCTINNNDNAASLTLNKVVVNDNGGTASESDWTLSAVGPTPLSGPGAAGSTDVVSGPTFSAGTYTLSESAGPNGYSASAWVCTGGSQNGNQITVGLGQSAVCTITNDDNAPVLHLRKTITNDNGGNALATAWTLTATGTDGSPTNLSGSTPVDSGSNFKADTYALAESGGPSGYTAGAWNCVGGAMGDAIHVTVALGESATCTINNDDQPASLTLVKHLPNDNGGTATQGQFAVYIDGVQSSWGPHTINAGSYTVSEDTLAGYTPSVWSGDCNRDGTVTLGPGESKTCEITNDDQPATLTLVKTLPNDNGGTATQDDFAVYVDGQTSSWGSHAVSAGTYTVSEDTLTGYTPSAWGEDCSANGTVTLLPGESKTCTIINDDVAPHLIVIKHVINDNGGSAVAGDFTMQVDATNVSQSAFAGAESPGTDLTLDAGDYSVSEDLLAGYTANYSGDCEGTIEVGETKTCTITNDDNYSKIIVTKFRDDNGNGTRDEGESVLPNWEMNLASEGGTLHQTTDSNGKAIFALLLSDFYTLSETEQPGFQFTGIECPSLETSSEVNRLGIELGANTTVSCTVGNKPQNPVLTISKTVTNTDGSAIGDKAPGDAVLFTLTVINTQSPAYNVLVTDLPSAGFTYRAGSWSAKLNGGAVAVPEPTYHSPGVWTLGTMNVDDVFELSYIADISGDQKPGLYKDLAWADGCKTDAPCSVGDAMSVLADAVDPGFIDTNYVGTQVNVVKDQQNGATLNPQTGEVLGASTELPATGADSVWLTLAALLFVFGVGLIAAGKYARRHYV